MTEGIKHDKGKPRWDLLPWEAVTDVVKIMTYGADKYTPHNWKLVEPERYVAALMRHLVAHETGEQDDPETGFPHLAHVACNALFLLYIRRYKK